MRFEFYRIEAGEFASVKFRELQHARIEAHREHAKQAVNDQFKQLIGSSPEIPQIIVFSPTIGDPPGLVVAVELVTANPRSDRQLVWVTDPMFSLT